MLQDASEVWAEAASGVCEEPPGYGWKHETSHFTAWGDVSKQMFLLYWASDT